jgi:hypothetical protein
MTLRRRLFKQGAHGHVVLRPTAALRNHHAELKLRFRRIGFRRLRKQVSGLDGIRWRAAPAGERREIGDEEAS